eukprot:m.1134619 g.1134619  ORF g.1134619 m.1134619 type:complete len:276 (+) comp24427_c1_seq75:644-1471(+)
MFRSWHGGPIRSDADRVATGRSIVPAHHGPLFGSHIGAVDCVCHKRTGWHIQLVVRRRRVQCTALCKQLSHMPGTAGLRGACVVHAPLTRRALVRRCQSLLGQGNVRVPHGAQVAVRFPLPPLADVAGSAKGPGGKAWHVDGFGQNQHSPFTLLVGVCLSPTPRPLMGNFAVHPGAHWTLQDAVRRHVSEGASFFSAMDQEQRKPDLGPPVEVLMEPGDVVLAHQKLPHLGEENRSPFIRYQVYFRIHHVHHETLRDRWLDDLMLPFDGVRAAMA